MGKQVGRQQLLDRAIGLFRAKGYSATSIDEIVKACGITKGSLYYYFKGKEDLVLAAMDQVHDYFRTNIFSLIADVENPGAKELEAFNRAIEEFFSCHPDGCMLANLCLEIGAADALFAERIHSFFNDWRACYLAIFARKYTFSSASTLAEDALAIVHGCILMHRINGNFAPLRRQHARLVDLLAREGAPS
ncbi:MAG: TetR/AcrR family transcriptional regulator [Betaproteobacteria bacterium]|nr:TetR/AcrR family transcriptional regulator [Betaproteobacteria bacterium]